MMHKMRLNDRPFNMIKSGDKTIEMRLNDEKRRLINVGDKIEFQNRITLDIIYCKVVKLHKYDNFYELYKHFNKKELGYKENEKASYTDMDKYYSNEEQNKYGVVGIEIALI